MSLLPCAVGASWMAMCLLGAGNEHNSSVALASGVGIATIASLEYLRWRRRRLLNEFRVPDANIIIAHDGNSTARALDELLRDNPSFLGVDAEWRPTTVKGAAKNPVAILQLSTGRVCVLVQMIQLLRSEGAIPPRLVELLKNRHVLKVGVGIAGDARKLAQDYAIQMCGNVELQALAVRHGYSNGGIGLKRLVRVVLNQIIAKESAVQLSNWDEKVLSREQVVYAANDAFAGYLAFERIFELHGDGLDVLEWVHGVVDKKFRAPSQPSRKQTITPSKAPKQRSEEDAMSKTPARTRGPLYENCVMISKDGTPLCTTSKKKVEWYLSRKLADKVSDDPLTIQLRFDANGPGHAGDEFYMSEKFNKCVGCGVTEELMRHHVVPRQYRRCFPKSLKSHSSHDIVLLCRRCHYSVAQQYDLYKRQIALEYGLDPNDTNKFYVDPQMNNAKRAGGALLNAKNLPPQRVLELTDVLREHYSKSDITDEDIAAAAALDPRQARDGAKSHGEAVVTKIEDLDAFVRRWRQLFLKTLKPRHLPTAWAVDHADHPHDDRDD